MTARRSTLSPVPVEARGRWGRWLGCALVLAGCLMVVGWLAFTARQLLDHARSLQSHLQALEGLTQAGTGGAGLGELEAAGAHVVGMERDLVAIQARVGPFAPAGRWLEWVPRYGGDLAAASDLLAVAVRASSAGNRVWQALSPALERLEGPAGEPVTARVLPVLVAAQPQLRAAGQDLDALSQARARVDAGSLSPRVRDLLDRLDPYLPWFEVAVDGALLAPDLLGADGPRTYLVLVQNQDELRATGGFISAVGELRIEGGRLAALEFRDSYAVDNPSVPHDLTPPDLQNTLYGELWFFRDTNWDADFPTSARRALDVYARDRGVQADGVVTVDQAALRLFLDAMGPLRVEGQAEPVTGANVEAMIRAEWSRPVDGGDSAEWWLHRKDLLGQIAGAALDRLMEGQGVPRLALAQALRQALDEKHVLVYLADPQAADLLRRRNWDGALAAPSAPRDTLLVVDSNVGYNKADANVTRSIHYGVDLAGEDGPRARVTLRYHNRSTRAVTACVQEARYGERYADMTERCYWDYVRVYVPAGSRLLQGPDLPLPSGSVLVQVSDLLPARAVSPARAEGDWMVWAAFFDLAPGQERTLVFDYQLPARVLERRADGQVCYRLRVQKQPGTEAVPLEVEVALPPGAELVGSQPAGLSPGQRVRTDLRTDREVEIVFRGGTGRP
jgi:hypothetical protein